MPSNSRLLSYLLLTIFLSGCAANDLMVKRQSESEAKIEFLLQSSKKAEQRQNEFAGMLQVQEERLQSAITDIRQLKDENRELRSFRDEQKVKQQLQTPKVEIVNQLSPAKTTKETGPPAEYLKAFGLYSANNFAAAIESFASFLATNRQSDYAANAAYWIGECHYSLSDLPKAREAFQRVADIYPKSSKAPDALLKLGYTLAALKEKDKATSTFEKVITAYPSSAAAAKARERLNAH